MDGENDYVDVPNVTRPNRLPRISVNRLSALDENAANESLSDNRRNSTPSSPDGHNVLGSLSEYNNNNDSNVNKMEDRSESNGQASTSERVYSNVQPYSNALRRNRPEKLNLKNTITVNGTSQQHQQSTNRQSNTNSEGMT